MSLCEVNNVKIVANSGSIRGWIVVTKYPEFLEIKWEQAKDLSRVEITFDPSYDFIFDKKPRSYDTASIPSLIKEYKNVLSKT